MPLGMARLVESLTMDARLIRVPVERSYNMSLELSVAFKPRRDLPTLLDA